MRQPRPAELICCHRRQAANVTNEKARQQRSCSIVAVDMKSVCDPAPHRIPRHEQRVGRRRRDDNARTPDDSGVRITAYSSRQLPRVASYDQMVPGGHLDRSANSDKEWRPIPGMPCVLAFDVCRLKEEPLTRSARSKVCLLYTSDAADDL